MAESATAWERTGEGGRRVTHIQAPTVTAWERTGENSGMPTWEAAAERASDAWGEHFRAARLEMEKAEKERAEVLEVDAAKNLELMRYARVTLKQPLPFAPMRMRV